ncbi:hypothetical protein BDR22DRAFT_875267 [Usnea florida]
MHEVGDSWLDIRLDTAPQRKSMEKGGERSSASQAVTEKFVAWRLLLLCSVYYDENLF